MEKTYYYGVMLDKDKAEKINDSYYKFVFDGRSLISDSTELRFLSLIKLSEEEITKRFSGTKGILGVLIFCEKEFTN